jgi:hypothetical protein
MPTSEDDEIAEMEELKKIFPAAPSERLEFLYGNLTILDGKTASLLTFNALGLAVLAVWLTRIPPNKLHAVLDLVFIVFLISCALCLATVNVFWSPTSHFRAEQFQLTELIRKRNQRTRFYRGAWRTLWLAVLVLIGVSLFHGAGTALRALGRCQSSCQELFSESQWGTAEPASKKE